MFKVLVAKQQTTRSDETKHTIQVGYFSDVLCV